MGKNILRKHYENMYGNNKPLQSNKNINSLLKNITVNDAEGVDNYNNPNNTNNMNNTNRIKNLIVNNDKQTNKYLPEVSTPSTFGFGGILLLSVFLILVMVLIYFRDTILKFFTNIKSSAINSQSTQSFKSLESAYNDMLKKALDKSAENNSPKNKESSQFKESNEQKIEVLNKTINAKEEEIKTTQSNISNGAIGQVNQKLADMCNFKKETNVTKNGFCYIGYDLGKRECTDVYAGDICMSGDIFPTMATCQNPKLRE